MEGGVGLLELVRAKGFDFGFEGEGSGLTRRRVGEEVEDGKEGAGGVLKGGVAPGI